MLRIHNLSKRLGDHSIFQGLTRSFKPGCIALCEEESTGKSTLLAIIAGVVAPSDGDVFIDGHSLRNSPQQTKARIAYVPDNCLQFPDWTGRQLLEKTAAEKNVPLDDAVLQLVDKLELTPHLDKRFEQMSTGTRRKVYLTTAALGEPSVVVADGPTNGVDSRACAALAQQFKAWGADRVVLFATHDAEFVQACGAQTYNIAAP